MREDRRGRRNPSLAHAESGVEQKDKAGKTTQQTAEQNAFPLPCLFILFLFTTKLPGAVNIRGTFLHPLPDSPTADRTRENIYKVITFIKLRKETEFLL